MTSPLSRIILISTILLTSCATGKITERNVPISDTLTGSSVTQNAIDPAKPPVGIKANSGKIEIINETYNPSLVDKNPILINDLATFRIYLMSKSGKILYEWPLGKIKQGNDATLLPDGRMLASMRSDNPKIILGGFGGATMILGKTGDILWNYVISSEESMSHHDVEMLPNGNLLTLVWTKVDKSVSQDFGYKAPVNIYPEKLVEIDPQTNTVVWEWNSIDHLIQDIDPKISDYGDISKNPGRININHMLSQSGMVMHGNGIAYDPKNDLIYVSVYNFSEIWAIDHSTTSQEARGSSGGDFDRGGDLVYRFGNPGAYSGSGERFLFSSHHPSFTNSGTFLIYSNGISASPEQSSVFELKLPEELDRKESTLKAPKVVWSYTNPDIYFDKVGGAVRAPNGNIIITEGDGCIWEVTPEKEVVWKYCSKPGMFWRTYVYPYGSPELKSLGIEEEK